MPNFCASKHREESALVHERRELGCVNADLKEGGRVRLEKCPPYLGYTSYVCVKTVAGTQASVYFWEPVSGGSTVTQAFALPFVTGSFDVSKYFYFFYTAT